jgi:hypothetical protein
MANDAALADDATVASAYARPMSTTWRSAGRS